MDKRKKIKPRGKNPYNLVSITSCRDFLMGKVDSVLFVLPPSSA
jgi:hypothetical protein